MSNHLPNQYGNRQPTTNIFQTFFPKPASRTTRNIIQNAEHDALELACDERLTEQAIDGVAYLDAKRIMKARTAEGNALMFELEAGYASRAVRKIANRNSPLAGL